MKTTRPWLGLCWLFIGISWLNPGAAECRPVTLQGGGIGCEVEPQSGDLVNLASRVGGFERAWMTGAACLTLRNESTGLLEAPVASGSASGSNGAVVIRRSFPKLSVELAERWSHTASGLSWDMELTGAGPRAGYELVLELPVLADADRVFTPTDRGVMRLETYPTFQPAAYGSWDWNGGSYVLPLVSVFDSSRDHALTLALPADATIPHLQVAWRDRHVLVLRLGHRALGGGRPASLRILLYAHPADLRSVLKAYSDDFPAYFRPGLPRGPYEGAFWYHHIQRHPDFEEMARQKVRFIWASFWFTHLGNYMPDEPEWHPYTYAAWWKLGETMSDAKINAFIGKMHERGIGTYAYLNLTEYGGKGGRSGDPAEADRLLREEFADALLKNAAGRPIPTWEGAMAMNPGSRYSLWPVLEEQVRRHIRRLPDFDGFVVDRLDWAGAHGTSTDGYDYAHDDGVTMVGDRPAENMADAIAEAIQSVCRISHQAGKRVFVNQFYRVELLRDVDGYCHEDDYLPAMSYLSPYRPASAWHEGESPYQEDLLAFEAQLKRRLQCALFPQMIAHYFPISQQRPDPRAADMLEVYAPLFETLVGKQQVLEPHCVEVSGANDANLYVNGRGDFVVPVTSRWRFMSRPNRAADPVTVRLRLPGGGPLKWAHAWSADGAPTRVVPVYGEDGLHRVTLPAHATASVIVAGRNAEPALEPGDAERLMILRRKLFSADPMPAGSRRPELGGLAAAHLRIQGTHVGFPEPVAVRINGIPSGSFSRTTGLIDLPTSGSLPDEPPRVRLEGGCDGVWFVPDRIDLLVKTEDGTGCLVAGWRPSIGRIDAEGAALLAWRSPEPIVLAKPRAVGKDTSTGGAWPARYGSLACWIPTLADPDGSRNGFLLSAAGNHRHVWPESRKDDRRILQHSQQREDPPPATCWTRGDAGGVNLKVTPPDDQPYRLTLYMVDLTSSGRVLDVAVTSPVGFTEQQSVAAAETAAGVYLMWSVRGETQVQVRHRSGDNAVVSGVFIDPEPSP